MDGKGESVVNNDVIALKKHTSPTKHKTIWLRMLALVVLTMSLAGLGSYIYHYTYSEPTVVLADSSSDKTITLSDDIGSSAKGNVTNSNVGNAWALFGKGDGILQVLTSSSYSASYGSVGSSVGKVSGKDMSGAANFGYQLYASGLDHSFSGGDSSGIITLIGRLLGGFVIFVGLVMSAVTSWGFNLIVTLANDLNVFDWVNNARSMSNSNPFKAPAMMIYNLYATLQNFGIVFATLAFALTVALAIFGLRFRGVGSGILQSFSRWLMRAFILFGAVFIIGGCYSSMLSYLKNAYDTPQASAYAVYSNIVDFQDWAEHSRLAWPSGMSSKMSNSDSSSNVYLATHGDVIKINEAGAGLTNAKNIDANLKGNYTQLTDSSSSSKVPDISNSMATMAFLWDWMSTGKYRGSDWNSYVQSQQNSAKKAYSAKDVSNDGSYKRSGGSLVSNAASYSSGAKIGKSSNAGLSTAGTYNYMLSVFDNTGFTITTSAKLSNLYSVPYHSSFGLSGRGLVAMGNYFIMVGLVYAVAVMSIFFMLFAIRAVVKGVPEIMGKLFTTGATGSPLQFLSLLMAMFVLIIELFGGAVLFAVTNYLVVGFASFGDAGVTKVVSGFTDLVSPAIMHFSSVKSAGLATTATINSTTYAAANIFEALLVLWVTFVMIKYRGKVLTSVGQALEDSIKKALSFADNRVAQAPGKFGAHEAGLPSTDGDNNNIFSRNYGGNGSGSNGGGSGAGGGVGNSGLLGDGSGSLTHTNGADERSTRLAHPSSILGRRFNKKQTLKDADAHGYGMGSKAYKARHAMAQAIDGIGMAVGSKGLRNLADDMEDKTQAGIDDGLSKYADAKRANKLDENGNKLDDDTSKNPDNLDDPTQGQAGTQDSDNAGEEAGTPESVLDMDMPPEGTENGNPEGDALSSVDPNGDQVDGKSKTPATDDMTDDASKAKTGKDGVTDLTSDPDQEADGQNGQDADVVPEATDDVTPDNGSEKGALSSIDPNKGPDALDKDDKDADTANDPNAKAKADADKKNIDEAVKGLSPAAAAALASKHQGAKGSSPKGADAKRGLTGTNETAKPTAGPAQAKKKLSPQQVQARKAAAKRHAYMLEQKFDPTSSKNEIPKAFSSSEAADDVVQKALGHYNDVVSSGQSPAAVASAKAQVQKVRQAAAATHDNATVSAGSSNLVRAGYAMSNKEVASHFKAVQNARQAVTKAQQRVATVGGTQAQQELASAKQHLAGVKQSAVNAGIKSSLVGSRKDTNKIVSELGSSRVLAASGLAKATTAPLASPKAITSPAQSNSIVTRAMYDQQRVVASGNASPAQKRMAATNVVSAQKAAVKMQANAPARAAVGRNITNKEVIHHLVQIQKAQRSVGSATTSVMKNAAQRTLKMKLNAAQTAGIRPTVLRNNETISKTIDLIKQDVGNARQGKAPIYKVDQGDLHFDPTKVISTHPTDADDHVRVVGSAPKSLYGEKLSIDDALREMHKHANK